MGRAIPTSASLECDAEKEMDAWFMPGLSFPIDKGHNHQPTPHTWGQDTATPFLPTFLGRCGYDHYFQLTLYVPAAVLQTQGLTTDIMEVLQHLSAPII